MVHSVVQPSEHYERLLARHYAWMIGGDLERAASDQRELLISLGVGEPPSAPSLAIDLGAGPGPQSFALADLGYSRVLALDSSRELLHELAAHPKVRRAVEPIECDFSEALLDVVKPGEAAIAVCMGDTLAHLSTPDAVVALLGDIHTVLAPGGVFIATYRDLTVQLEGLDRFVALRADDDRVMHCFLEAESEQVLRVHDLVWTRDSDGWQLHKSSYPKLRLSPDWIEDRLTAAGFTIGSHQPSQSGLWATVGIRRSER